LDFTNLVNVEVHSVEKNPEMISSKKLNFFSTEKKKDMNLLDGIGVRKL